MSKDWNDILRVFGLIIVFGLIMLTAIWRIGKLEDKIRELENAPTDTVFLDRIDTVLYDNPELIERYESEKEQVAIEVRRLRKQLAEVLNLPQDTTFIHDTTTELVYLPREFLTYKDSTYKAIVSGVDPRLESIEVYQKTKTEIVTKTLVKKEPTRWGVGVQIGVGICKNKVQPYVGAGVSYNLITW